MAHRTNARPAPCAKCSARVDANLGTLLGPPWTVVCQKCLPFPSSSAGAKIDLRWASDRVEVKPSSMLGKARWDVYKAVLDGAGVRAKKDVMNVWHHYARIDQIAQVIAGLSEGGFVLDVEDGIREQIKTASEPAKQDEAAAALRVEHVDAELAKRGKALFSFQREGVAWLAPRAGALLADDMGLGKSVQTLASIPEGAPVLVIGPAVAKGVWKREANAWRPDLKVSILAGRGSFRWPSAGELVVTNYDILPDVLIADAPRADGDKPSPVRVASFLADCPKGLVLIIDEAHNCKNRGAKDKRVKRTERVSAIATAARDAGGRCWELTATPLLSNPPELWTILNIAGIAKEAFPGGWMSFCTSMGGHQEVVYGKYGPIKNKTTGKDLLQWVWGGPIKPAAVAALKRVMLRRVKDEVLKDLPALTYQYIDVELPEDLRGECDELWDVLRDDFENVFEGKKKGIPFEQISEIRAKLAAAKIEQMDAIVEEYDEAAEPLVVFSCHRAPVEHLGEREGWAVILGGIDAAKRTQIEQDFQAGKLKGVACTVKAGGVAITLTRANHALFVDEDWTPALNDQARDRIRRIGTTKPVLVKVLVGDHELERRVAELLDAKRKIIAGSVEAARVGVGEHARTVTATLDKALAAIDNQEEALRKTMEAELAHAEATKKLLADLAAQEEEDKKPASKLTPAERLERTITRAAEREHAKDGQSPRRPAMNEAELWAGNALLTLAACDDDHAAIQNEMGFNRSDTGVGHALARALTEGLTDRQWAFALAMLRKYHGQVGKAPEVK